MEEEEDLKRLGKALLGSESWVQLILLSSFLPAPNGEVSYSIVRWERLQNYSEGTFYIKRKKKHHSYFENYICTPQLNEVPAGG